MNLIITIASVSILSLLAGFIDAFLLDKDINWTKYIYGLYGMLELAVIQQFLWR